MEKIKRSHHAIQYAVPVCKNLACLLWKQRNYRLQQGIAGSFGNIKKGKREGQQVDFFEDYFNPFDYRDF